MPCFKAGFANADFGGPLVQLVVPCVGFLRHVRQQQFQHHFLRSHSARAVGDNFHAGGGSPAARGREHPFTVNLDHAGPAISYGLHAFTITKVGYLQALSLSHFQNRLAGVGSHLFAVEAETQGRVYLGVFLAGHGVHRESLYPVISAWS